MNIDEVCNLYSELAKDETTLERKTEIMNSLRQDYEEKNQKYDSLVESTSKLQDDYKKLQAKKVDEFFKVGTPVEEVQKETIKDDTPTCEEIAYEMLKGEK